MEFICPDCGRSRVDGPPGDMQALVIETCPACENPTDWQLIARIVRFAAELAWDAARGRL